MSQPPRKPTLWESMLPILIAAAIICVGIVRYRDQAPVPILLMLSCIAPAALAIRLGFTWREVEAGIIKGMTLSLQAAVILLVVGTTIGAWAACGTVAAMIKYGLLVLTPSFFLPAASVICAVVALAIGSSWTTAATVGVALMGIGGALGLPAPITAGAVISGAYFGDKMSPLSDTTNLAPGIAGAKLFEHIAAMFYTTVPAFVIALVLYTLIGLFGAGDTASYDPQQVNTLRAALEQGQHLSPWLLLPPVLVIALALLRVPAIPALLAASGIGLVFAGLFQEAELGALLKALYSGHVSSTGNAGVDDLLSRGGMASMLDTIALVLCATAFGGVMEKAGFIQVILEALLTKVRSVAGLITTTVASTVGVNFLLAEQYLAIVLPGRMYRDTFPRFGLQPRMLSRTLEDGGTVTSALCPWNSCGAFMASTLGVATFTYAPWAFVNYLIPLIAITYAWTNTFILRQEAAPPEDAPAATEG